MTTDDALSLRRAASRVRRGLLLGNVIIVLLVAGLLAVAMGAGRGVFSQRALDATRNLSNVLERSIASELARVDDALRAVALAHAHEGGREGLRSAALRRAIDDQQILAPAPESLRLADASGSVVYGRGVVPDAHVNVGDRDYFVQATRSGAQARAILSEPLLDRIDKRWTLVMARRLDNPDGTFAGVVFATLPAAYFEGLLGAVDPGENGAVALRTTSLKLVARYTRSGDPTTGIGSDAVSQQLREAIRANPHDGTYVAPTALDQIERANAYVAVDDFPLLVIAGLSTDDYLAPWRAQVIQVSALALLAEAVLAVSSLVLFRAWRKEAAASRALILEGNRHRALMLTASDGIHVLDRSGRVVDLNDAFADMLGAPREKVLQMRVVDWDERFDRHTLHDMLARFTPGQRFEVSTRFRRQDGAILDVEVTGSGVRIDEHDFLYCSARDVTERRRAERSLRASEAFLDRTGRIAGVGGWEMNLRSGELAWSGQTCRIHDVGPAFKPTLEQALAFCADDERNTIETAVRACMHDGTPWDLELPLVTAQGRRIWVRSVGEAEFEGPRPTRLIGAIQDITERRFSQAELAREQKLRSQIERHAGELDRLLQERNEMIDVLAHEVRQPLNNASAALQSAGHALGEVDGTAASSRLARAQSVMGQVLASIDNTLAVASLLARPDPIAVQDVDIDTLVAVAIADMPAGERGRIRISRITSTRTASMDMSLMRLALRNLISNALKYSAPGSPVEIRLSDSDDPLALVIDVIDLGAGVDPDLVPRLFDRGARRDRGSATAGHGVGLYIVRRVMELHGGRAVLARSGPEGTTMRLVVEQSPEA